MACINHSAVTLRIIGDELIPARITETFGVLPTHAVTKGDKIIGKKTGTVKTARSGMWQLKSLDREPEDLDGQIREILGQLTTDLNVWKSLASRYKMDLFCGLFMECSNEGMNLSPESLLELGSRGIKIGFCIYAPISDEEEITSEQGAAGNPLPAE